MLKLFSGNYENTYLQMYQLRKKVTSDFTETFVKFKNNISESLFVFLI